jgi:predicted porin
MKKILLATFLASLTGMSLALEGAPTDSAAQSSVKMYGVLSEAFYKVDSGSSAIRNQSGTSSYAGNSSKLGVIGSEDLGGGTKAGFNLETQINMNTGAVASSATGAAQSTSGTSEVFNRAANVSLSNSQWGELKMGRQITPLYENISAFDAVGLNSMGMINYFVSATTAYGVNTITGQNAGTNLGNATSSNTNPDIFTNAFQYRTPTYAGVSVRLFTSPGSGSTSTQNSGALREGTINYEGQGQLTGLKLVAGYGTTDTSTTGVTGQSRSLFGASYDWNKFKFSASRAYIQYYTGAIPGTVLGDNTLLNQVGVKYRVTAPWWVGAEYTTAADHNVRANKSSTVGLASGYEFSKRTSVYGFVGSTQNSGAASVLPVYGTSATGTSGVSSLAYVMGLRHAF